MRKTSSISSKLNDHPVDVSKIETDLMHRLTVAIGSKSNSSVSRDTGFHQESVRRYRATGRMPATFLIALSQVYSINLDWLVSGDGNPSSQRRNTESVSKVLREIADQLSTSEKHFSIPATPVVDVISESIQSDIFNGTV